MTSKKVDRKLIRSFTKKDFKIEWFNPPGGGGQHKNKHANACRIKHLESGLKAQSTGHKERPANQKAAFKSLAGKLKEHYFPKKSSPREKATETIRTYHEPRNQVKDHASGFTQEYTYVVEGGNIGEMIEARMKAIYEEIDNS